jgi:CRISPR/Cas system-associated exonuclease Cas4 (RecB family)
MQLISLADLQRPEEQIGHLIQHAQRLGELWVEFLKQDTEKYEYTVYDGGEKERSAGIHASEMSKCMTKLVYSIMGAERRPDTSATDVNMKLRFRTGTALHSMIQSDFKRMAVWYTKNNSQYGYALDFTPEVKIREDLQTVAADWGLSSHCDGIFTLYQWQQPQEGSPLWAPVLRLGLEIKTSSGGQYEDRKRPEPDHLEQTCLYQATLDLPLMWLLYYNKDNSNFTTPYAPWLYKFDRNLWERELEMRFAKAHHYAETRQMPERTEGRHCRWCPFGYICKPKVLEQKVNYGPPVVSPGMLVRRN